MGKIIGCDPGVNGGITCLDETGRVEFIKVMPKDSEGIDILKLNEILQDKDIECVFVEKVHAIHGSSAESTFTFGGVVAAIKTILVVNKIKHVYVTPKEWQKEMFQGVKEIRKPSKKNKKGKEIRGKVDTKEMSAIACKRLFPNEKFLPTERCTKIHDGMTDSALIAEYGRRRLSGKV